jgi:hypothetical protein
METSRGRSLKGERIKPSTLDQKRHLGG